MWANLLAYAWPPYVSQDFRLCIVQICVQLLEFNFGILSGI